MDDDRRIIHPPTHPPTLNRLPSLPAPAKGPKAAMAWVVPGFLRNLRLPMRFGGGGGSGSGSRMAAGARLRRTVGSVQKRGRLASAAASALSADAAPVSYYQYQEPGPGPQMGTLEGAAVGQAGADIHGLEADSVPIVIKCE